MKINEEFQVHEELNPLIWENGQLRPEVKQKIVEIVASFEQYVEVPIHIVDIQIVGSNASYNYTENSDLDVHVIANFELASTDTELLQAVYNMKKTQFNKSYDISIHGVEVEMYIQDVKTNIVSNGIYSVCDDAWIKEPKPIKTIKKHDVQKELDKWAERINQVIVSQDYEEIANTINILYLMRANSIATDGEYGKGNQLFKEIRSQGYLAKLKSALDKSYSKKLSLESLSRGQLVNIDFE